MDERYVPNPEPDDMDHGYYEEGDDNEMIETKTVYNPHPSRDPRYDVLIVRDNKDGTVDVAYLSGGSPWTVNDNVPELWGRVER